MIPDGPYNFNDFGTSSNYAAQYVHLHHPFLQGAMLTQEAGRHQLLVCPVCKQPWYKAGRHDYPHLTPEQLTFLGAVLQVDIQALYLFPRALCSICSALHLTGMFSAEIYPHLSGYRFLWERVSPCRIQLLAIVCRGEELTLDTLNQMTPEPVAELTGEMRSVLAWLEVCPSSDTVQAFTNDHSQLLACHCPLGNTVNGNLCQWRGYTWETICPTHGGTSLILLAVTTRSSALPLFASLRMAWLVLARTMRAVL